MEPDDILGFAVVIAVLIIPALAFTARFALKPTVESILGLRNSLDRGQPSPVDQRLTALEERVAGMESLLDRIAQTVEFDAHLRAGSRPAPAVPPSPAGPRLVRTAEPAPAPAPPLPLDPADYEEEYQ